MSRRVWWIAMGLGGWGAACVHAHSTPQPPPRSAPSVVQDTAGFTLATSPAGLLRPGAQREIQHQLVERGLLTADQVTGHLDAPTQAALLRFQKSVGLAETGLPGYGTVEKLGLEPERVFRAAERDEPDASAPP